MQLNPHAREWYRLGIATTPEVTTWEASFDGGTTWKTAITGVEGWAADDFGWLVAGPSADPTDATVITGTVRPLLRATAAPETVVRVGPPIAVTA